MTKNTNDISKQMNPDITDVLIGIRDLRKIKIYPLSVGDQLELTDLITDTIKAFFSRDPSSVDDNEFVFIMLDVLKTNLNKVLTLATCGEEENINKEITNKQLIEICNILYKVNFEELKKTLLPIIQKFLTPQNEMIEKLKKQSPTSVKNMDTE